MELKSVIAKNIIQLRQSAGMTQLDLAEKMNYSDKAVSKWERGESIPDVITLKKMADLFGVTVDYMISEHTEPIKPRASKVKRNNQIAISLIVFFAVWLIGTCIFVLFDLFEQRQWFAFVFCIPISTLVLVIFNSIWGRKSMNMFLISSLMWTMFLTVYIALLLYVPYNFWMIFIIGIPGQIIILLCFRIKGHKTKLTQTIIDHYANRPKRVKKQKKASDTDKPDVAETMDERDN